MYAAIVFLPLLGFLIAGPFGWRIGARPSEIVTTSLSFASAILSWIVFIQVALGTAPATVSVIGTWFTSGALKVDWSLKIDTLTAVMLVVVGTVSSLAHLYSIGYMSDDPSRPRFFAFLSLFTFAMLMLVTADNLVQLFFGWEGVGLMSYLLIGFWYEKPSANAAAIEAFVVNRVGDFGFALGIFLLFTLTNSVGFDQIFAAAPGLANKTIHVFGLDMDAMTITCLLLFMGAMGKSAQFLLHTWLPDAMEGPTPVSALIHAATMVTAGVFMVARLSPMFEASEAAMVTVMLVGAITAFFAATVALVQNDIKRVIAYSTCSQLGYMFVGLGVGGYSLGIFHLFTHAFFKALLFLSAGSVIIAMHHEQDMRNMGGLWRRLPFTFAMMTIGTLSITGFSYTAGYYSKDAIIEAAYASDRMGAFYAFLLTTAAAGLTSFYSWRLIFLTFFGAPRWAPAGPGSGHESAAHGHEAHGPERHALHPHESPVVMLIPLGVLAIGALFAGLVFTHDFIGNGYSEFWQNALYLGPDN
ncbi:MAG: NADH-quinone oxidoreductase subunit L, partial [Methylocella sp.]